MKRGYYPEMMVDVHGKGKISLKEYAKEDPNFMLSRLCSLSEDYETIIEMYQNLFQNFVASKDRIMELENKINEPATVHFNGSNIFDHNKKSVIMNCHMEISDNQIGPVFHDVGSGNGDMIVNLNGYKIEPIKKKGGYIVIKPYDGYNEIHPDIINKITTKAYNDGHKVVFIGSLRDKARKPINKYALASRQARWETNFDKVCDLIYDCEKYYTVNVWNS